jgi:hypothetical protein
VSKRGARDARQSALLSLGVMNKQKDIVPWTCHICGRRFDTIGGGICNECGKATCIVCFGVGAFKNARRLKLSKPRTCRTCADRTTKPKQ